MVSEDLSNFLTHLRAMKDKGGELHLSSETVSYLELALEDVRRQARRLERPGAAKIVLFDINDPKIAQFPVVRRSIPVTEGDT